MEVAGWFIGAGIGIVFTALYDGVKELMRRTTKLKAQLEALELTLETFDIEAIEQIGRYNEALGHPNEDLQALKKELRRGLTIIGELSHALNQKSPASPQTRTSLAPHAAALRRSEYHLKREDTISQLMELDRSLKKLRKRLEWQSMRDLKETQYMMTLTLLTILTPHQEPCRDGNGSLLLTPRQCNGVQAALQHIASTSKDIQPFNGNGSLLSTTRPLDIGQLHHILTTDPLSNIASTSTDIQQFNGNGEIQVDQPPFPLGNSNNRGSHNQPQFGGQRVTSSVVVQKIVLKLALQSDGCRMKAMKVATSVAGVRNLSIKRDSDQMEVIGSGVDGIALAMLLRKKLGYVRIVAVLQVDEGTPVPDEELTDPIERSEGTSKYTKISAWFKRSFPLLKSKGSSK